MQRPNECANRLIMATIGFIISALLLFFFTLHFGGQPWAVLCLIALNVQAICDLRGPATLVSIAPCLLWLSLSSATGNRELFFPYSMYLASYVALLLAGRMFWWGALGGTSIVAVFTAVRIVQSASAQVLFVEICVAVVILTLALATYLACPRNTASRVVVATFASFIAYVGLTI